MKNTILLLSLQLLATAVYAQKAPNAQLKYIDSLITRAANTANDSIKLRCYYYISDAYTMVNDFGNADAYAKKLYTLAKKRGDVKMQVQYCLVVSKRHIASVDYRAARKYAAMGSALAKKHGDIPGFLGAEAYYGSTVRYLNDIDAGMGRMKAAIRHGERNGAQDAISIKYIAGIQEEIALLYYSQGNHSQALAYLQQAHDYFGKINFTTGMFNCYNVMVAIYMDQEDWPSAKKYALLTVKDMRNVSIAAQIMAYSNFAGIETKLGNYEAALGYVDKALALGHRYNDNTYLAHNLEIKSDIYFHQRKYRAVIGTARAVLQIQPVDYDIEVQLYNRLSKTYLALRDTARARDYLEKIIRTVNIGSPASITLYDITIYKDVANALRDSGQYQLALQYFEKYAVLENERLTNEKNNRVNELQAQFDLNDKELKLNALTIERQKSQLIIAQQQNTVLFTIAALVLIAVAGSFFYWKSRISKKSNLLLQSKNAEIDNSLREKSLLLKEIHHRVKNNLQLIISLLNIQARENNHAAVDDFLEKGRGRIISMALIHQNLYEADNLAKVNFQQYLDHLIASNTAIYGAEMEAIAINTDAGNLNFDVETSIPLGLIINELLCNAMKYAFKEQHGGRIVIRLSQGTAGNYILYFSDNGKGLPRDAKAGNFGTELVKLLAMQLNGEVAVESTAGTAYTISFEDIAA